MAEDLKELFDELNLEEVILLGHSMGGKTAMKFAQNYPDYLEKLIVVDIGTKTYPSHHEQILAGLHAIDLNVIHSRSEAEEAMAKYIESNGVRQFLLKNLYWAQKGKLAWRMNIPVLEQEMWAILQGLPSNEVLIPTLFIRGMMSDYILGEDIPDLENQFSDSHFVSVENAGHWVHAEAPEEFIEAVLSFCLR